MAFFKRIFLFFAVNILVVTVISILLHLFNVQPYLQEHGLNYENLAIFCLIWGFGGALISLAFSRIMAKWMMGVHVIDPHTNDPALRRLLEVVYRLSRAADLSEMPEVGVYNSPEVNAFATGPSCRRSLIAVSSGLLHRVSPQELEGVIGHEVSHIVNGDMVTMTIIQGVINSFVMFLSRVLAFVFSGMGREKSSNTALYNMLIFLFQCLFMSLGFMVIAAYSRLREFKADRGGARLAGREKMIAALEALQKVTQIHDSRVEQPAFQALKISNPKGWGLFKLFSTHPSLEARIQRLQEEKASLFH